MPQLPVTHTEPFHVSTSVATLDHVSEGRAGVRVRDSWDPREYDNVGRRTPPSVEEPGASFAQVADHVEVARGRGLGRGSGRKRGNRGAARRKAGQPEKGGGGKKGNKKKRK